MEGKACGFKSQDLLGVCNLLIKKKILKNFNRMFYLLETYCPMGELFKLEMQGNSKLTHKIQGWNL